MVVEKFDVVKLLLISVLAWIGAFMIITAAIQLVPAPEIPKMYWQVIFGTALIGAAIFLGYRKRVW